MSDLGAVPWWLQQVGTWSLRGHPSPEGCFGVHVFAAPPQPVYRPGKRPRNLDPLRLPSSDCPPT
ncbi:hypothetical protein SAMN05414137_110110 [Streptacidiphilus jiangxiensis]|uniref:Uncharacterized protein n=1 Tax=Streptacidiphilus jiangxiensis TaxID=235985 RepID=A0A1H7RG27_STRJI|nr:hypothetical protein SAMN05414137_110110 [Streptacidiphilus jiangxiensis]